MKINFYPARENVFGIIDQPIPAISMLPEWYKKMSPTIDKSGVKILKDTKKNVTIKRCVPVFDAISGGYFITLPCDVIFNPKNQAYFFEYQWTGDFEAIAQHGEEQIKGLPVPQGFDPKPLKWKTPWIIETPRGYSSWITHPTGRYDLPFTTMTGFVDTDKHPLPVNLPFFLKKDFVGVIKMGTPIAQIIPIKRDSWNLNVEDKHPTKRENFRKRLYLYAEKSYRNFVWSKKNYK
jgi:hypothetical protein